MRPNHSTVRIFWILAAMAMIAGLIGLMLVHAQEADPSPPAETVKLIFIHHSTGENWLTDGYGNLGSVLGANNYFVSDTNYGWGPHSIGDATDIIDWPTWFRGPESERYLAALYAESGQNASYTRDLSDPGGENEIIMFKSCFPNSELTGNPNDPPAPDGGLTVSNAKYIYNDLLNYFITRPDKLFVVITAPPVQDSTYAANARAFNTWLMQDWLAENNYPYNNVAVWNFYNVLTGPDHHHRYHNGAIDHGFQPGQNTLYYPSDDDHPSPAGSQKATDEFAPMLNIFYHRWKAGAPPQPPARQTVKEQPTPAQSVAAEAHLKPAPAAPRPDGLLDDFEAGEPPNTSEWQAYAEHGVPTSITCALVDTPAYSGAFSRRIDFDVAADSWATCGLMYDTPQDWGTGEGLSFYVSAEQSGLPFAVLAHGGSLDAPTTYEYPLETPPESVDGWALIEVPWEQLLRVAWEADAGAPFDPTQAIGLALAFNGLEGAPNSGVIWVDDLHLMGVEPTQAPASTAKTPTEAEMPVLIEIAPLVEIPTLAIREVSVETTPVEITQQVPISVTMVVSMGPTATQTVTLPLMLELNINLAISEVITSTN